MKIKKQLHIYISTTVIALTVLFSIIIYVLFAEHREEEFQQRQKEKILYTLGLIAEYKELSENLSTIMDRHNIHDFYDEKMLIYDRNKQLIFKSIDDLPIHNSQQVLNSLSPANQWIETKEDDYDLIGVYVEREEAPFYAISKAYDAFGYTKLNFLQNILIIISLAITVIVLLISHYLSAKISKPITSLAEKLSDIDFSDQKFKEIMVDTTSYEINYLTGKFNELINRTKDVFAFQKHAVQHISHELKTPIAILVSELERAKSQSNVSLKDKVIESQIVNAKSLADIITVLLEVSKIESGRKLSVSTLRVDEIIFTAIEELAILYPKFRFEIEFEPDSFKESQLELKANELLVKQAFLNIMNNCIAYSTLPQAKILFNFNDPSLVKISFINQGTPIKKEEEKYLFHHFFKGTNSEDPTGFGLGLVLTQKIVQLHHGDIRYSNPSKNINIFELRFPLSKNLSILSPS
ncbi:MAG: HAMP domain-containing sensor histidine kinase [Arenibacter latericius]|nr:HAMP domain-containing sensor histidine kinase [Arenibacter latericius]